MKKKTIKILVVSTVLSLTMGCVALASSGTKQNNPNQIMEVQKANTESEMTHDGQKNAEFGTGAMTETIAAAQPALTRQQQHVVKTYNGQPQGEPVIANVRYVNGLEIISYDGLPEKAEMSAWNETYFYLIDERGFEGVDGNRLIDRYGNVFMQEKPSLKVNEQNLLWDIRAHRSGTLDNSFFLSKTDGNYNYTFYWYTKDGDLIGQIPGSFCSENTVDFNYYQVQRQLEASKNTGLPAKYGVFSIHGMMEEVLIVRENFIGDVYNDRYYYYDMQNNMNLIAVYTTNSILNTYYPPLVKNGVCYVPGDYYGILTVYDDSRIKFGNLESIIKTQDEDFLHMVDSHLYGTSGDIYAFQPSDSGWLIGQGSEGFQAYNIYSGKMVTFLPWNEYKGGHYPLCWWENQVTGYPYEFEKEGFMVVNIPEEGYNLTDMAIFNLNTGKLINNQRYEYINLPDYKERPMLYEDKNYKYGYLNDNFETIARYEDATTFSHGYALVSQDGWNYSVINENLEVVAENVVQAESVANVGHGLYELQYNNGYYYVYKYVYIGPQ